MVQINEQQITALAVNSAAVANGRKISQKGGFVKLMKSKDETFFMGECTGSGKSNYITSADYVDEEKPVFRCSCPSRQFPCKHSIALLFEMMAGKSFDECEIPEDIQSKRKKIQDRSVKAQAKSNPEEMTEEEKEALQKKAQKAKKAGESAKAKKITKQLEGLGILQKMMEDFLFAGIGTMAGANVKTYQDVSKQLGDYYLPGPQKLMNRLIFEISMFQKDRDEVHYEMAIDVVKKMWVLTKKSKAYLQDKLEQKNLENDDNILYEELGGIWKITELAEAGCGLNNSAFAEIAFYETFDEVAKEYVDNSVYVELNTGEIYINKNIRPLKAIKYIKSEDSMFGVAETTEAAYYPGLGNKRVRWDGASIRTYEKSDYEKLKSFAKPFVSTQVKEIKNVLKDTLSGSIYIKLIAYDQIGINADGKYILCDKNGDKIVLGDAHEMEGTCDKLSLLPRNLYKNHVIAVAFFENRECHRIDAQPISIITDDRIIRLLY